MSSLSTSSLSASDSVHRRVERARSALNAYSTTASIAGAAPRPFGCATRGSKKLAKNTTPARVMFGGQLAGSCWRAQVRAGSIASEETMSAVVRGGTFNIVRQVIVDGETLERIAELLGIPEAERGRVISGAIYISPPPSSPGGGAPPSPPSGRRRQRK